MKGNLFTIVFFILFIIAAGISDADTKELTETKRMKHKIEDSYMSAVDSAVSQLENSYEHDERLNKEKAAETFFYTLCAGLGIMDDPFLREQLEIYIPAIAVVVNEGIYILYNEEYQNAGKTEIRKIWSELITFNHEDEFFIYRFEISGNMTIYDKNNTLKEASPVISLTYGGLRERFIKNTNAPNHVICNEEAFLILMQDVIVSKIEECLTYYINLNNNIAERHGITYHFYLPAVEGSEWIRSINEVSMIAFFQGYPYNNGRNIYNQFAIAGATIKRQGYYYIVPEDYYYVYHTKGCPVLDNKEIMQTAHSMLECAEAGAVPCGICND